MSKREKPLEGETLWFIQQLSKTASPGTAAVLRFDGWLKEVKSLEARGRMLCNELNVHNRLESTN